MPTSVCSGHHDDAAMVEKFIAPAAKRALLSHVSVNAQSPTTSPPQGCTLPHVAGEPPSVEGAPSTEGAPSAAGTPSPPQPPAARPPATSDRIARPSVIALRPSARSYATDRRGLRFLY